MRVADILPAGIHRWHDGCAGRSECQFNRALPVLASLLKYAEVLRLRSKGSNPCRGMPYFRLTGASDRPARMTAASLQRICSTPHSRLQMQLRACLHSSCSFRHVRRRAALLDAPEGLFQGADPNQSVIRSFGQDNRPALSLGVVQILMRDRESCRAAADSSECARRMPCSLANWSVGLGDRKIAATQETEHYLSYRILLTGLSK
jgi:hypothetical protein